MNCSFRVVSEWDTTTMFMSAFTSNPVFLSLFLLKTIDAGKEYSIETVFRSKLETGLGETDLQVNYIVNPGKTDEETHAILIENKIDALETDNQYARYVLRAEKGVERGEFSSYSIFILCPEQYRNRNSEASKYPCFVSYEDCINYFEKKGDSFSSYCSLLLHDAISTAKHKNDTKIDPVAVNSLRSYKKYAEEHYPALTIKNNTKSGKVNGWWVKIGVSLKNASITHKTAAGAVDLSIWHSASKYNQFKVVEKWLNDSGYKNIKAVRTQNSSTFRIKVPQIDMSKPFDSWVKEDLNACLDAVVELVELADMFEAIRVLYERLDD